MLRSIRSQRGARRLGAAFMGFAWAAAAWAMWPGGTLACVPRVAEDTEVAPEVLVAVLHRVGLTPEALSVCGVGAEDVAPLIQRTATHLEGAEWALNDADDLCRARETEVLRLERAITTGTAIDGDAQRLASASELAVAARTARAEVLHGIFNAATDGMAQERVAILGTVRRNMRHGLSTDLLVVDRIQEQWDRINEAIAICRAHQEAGGRPPAEAEEFLASIRADPAVVAARENLVSLPLIRQAWRQAAMPR